MLAAAVLAGGGTAAFAAPAYRAGRAGEVVRLEDTKSQTVVSIIPSFGNIAFEMKVKGQNVLYFPFASVEDFKAKGPEASAAFRFSVRGPTGSTSRRFTPTASGTRSTWSSGTCAARSRSMAWSPPRTSGR